MNENITLFVMGILSSCIGSLVLILLGIIIYEIRKMRDDLRGCVAQDMCREFREQYDKRIETLEKINIERG